LQVLQEVFARLVICERGLKAFYEIVVAAQGLSPLLPPTLR
jgi:hypothetical protein